MALLAAEVVVQAVVSRTISSKVSTLQTQALNH
jgi:hypothetical protein